ncbi:hypothetical protein [Clostridium sp.]
MSKINDRKLRFGMKISLIIIIAMWIYFIEIMGFLFGGILSLIGTLSIVAIYTSWMIGIDKKKMNAFFIHKYDKKDDR